MEEIKCPARYPFYGEKKPCGGIIIWPKEGDRGYCNKCGYMYRIKSREYYKIKGDRERAGLE